MARLVRFEEEEEYAAPTRRLVKRDLETGEVEVLGSGSQRTHGPIPSAHTREDGAAASLPTDGDDNDGGEGAWHLPLPGEEDPSVAEEARIAHASGPSMPGLEPLVLALLLLAALGILWSRWRRRSRRQEPAQPQEAAATPSITDRLGPLLRSVGLWTPTGIARLSAEGAAGRTLLDAAIRADDPTAARGALERLDGLVREEDVPVWLRKALEPLQEERDAVHEVEKHHGRLLCDLEQATEAGQEAVEVEEARAASPLSVSSSSSASAASASLELDLIAAVARAREALKAHHGSAATTRSPSNSNGTAAAGLAGALENAEAVLAAIQHGRDQRVQQQIDSIKAACQRGLDTSSSQSQSGNPAAPLPSSQQQQEEQQQQHAPPLLLQNGENPTENGGEATEANSEPAVAAVAAVSSTSSESRHALMPAAAGGGSGVTTVAAVETTSTAVVVAGGGQQDPAALLSQLSQSIQMTTMLSTMASRISHLEEKLERQRESRGTHAMRAAGAARKERQERGERMRQQVRELGGLRERREVAQLGAEQARRQADQTLLTYLFPASFLVFGAGVVLATSDERGAPSTFLIDALWRMPLHDLVYGACARPAPKPGAAAKASSSTTKEVHYKPRPIAGAPAQAPAAGAGGLPWPLQALVDSVIPADGVAEMGACYVRRTIYLAVGLVAAALLHYLMGGVPGLDRHRAKLHVAMLAYAFQRHILRVTWRGLRSVRRLLALHALLWLASSGLDAGHAFAHRRLWLRGVVPAVLLAVALYDAAVYVDPVHPLQALHLMATRAGACLAQLGADDEDGEL